MVQKGREKNYTFNQPHLLIAALAELHGRCIVTRNEKDFETAGGAVLNPWNQHSRSERFMDEE